jgi:hypothetical protein
VKKVFLSLLVICNLFASQAFANSVEISPEMSSFISKHQKVINTFYNGLNDDKSLGINQHVRPEYLLGMCEGYTRALNTIATLHRPNEMSLITWIATAKLIDERCEEFYSYRNNRAQLSQFFQFGVIDKWLRGDTSFEVRNGKLQEKPVEPVLNPFNY